MVIGPDGEKKRTIRTRRAIYFRVLLFLFVCLINICVFFALRLVSWHDLFEKSWFRIGVIVRFDKYRQKNSKAKNCTQGLGEFSGQDYA